MIQTTKESQKTSAKRLLSKMKHPGEPGMLSFSSDEYNFAWDQKVNRRNGRWLRQTTEYVPTAMCTKFSVFLKVLGVMGIESDVMAPYFFSQGPRNDTTAYTAVKP